MAVGERVTAQVLRRKPYLRLFSNDPNAIPVWGGFSSSIPVMGMQGNVIVANPLYEDLAEWLTIPSQGGNFQYLGWFSPSDMVEVIVDHELGHWVYRRLRDRARKEWVATEKVELPAPGGVGRVKFETKARSEEAFAWYFMFWLNRLGHLMQPRDRQFFEEHVPQCQ
jgi:hypothetical protein